MDFKDHFSRQSDLYSRYRPHYPSQLFTFLSGLVSQRHLAWDCATGNGQAAYGLAKYFQRVVATDPSKAQLEFAVPHPIIEFLNEKAENCSLPDRSVDLVTIANALHWFNFNDFYTEANRVLKKNGIIAAWCYYNPIVNGAIDSIIDNFHDKVLGNYWLPENKLVADGYASVPFPFTRIETPVFYSERSFSLDDFLQYLRTWSAVQRYILTQHHDPVSGLVNELEPLWISRHTVKWQISLLVGRKVV